MLDLTKLAQQMQGISQHLSQESMSARRRLDIAEQLMGQAQRHQDELVALSQQWRDRLGFTAAEPVEPLDTRVDIAIAPKAHTVIATDGSQIAPNHHEIAYCYLINIGRIVLHYGQSRQPLLDSLPEVFYQPEDLYISRQWGIRTEEWMGHRRTVSEATALAELVSWVVQQASQKSRSKSNRTSLNGSHAQDPKPARNPKRSLTNQSDRITQPTLFPLETLAVPALEDEPPRLAMVDGSLIYWFLGTMPEAAREQLLPPILQAWDQLRSLGVPLVGYLSASRSGEALNFLRLQRCPHDEPDCLTHCPNQTNRAPCQVFDPLRDTAFWHRLLQPGQRGPLWRSTARILDLYDDHSIYFCHLHVGTEIARIEMPAWVATDPHLLNAALSLTLMQVHKGYGYPIALAEAHNQAVVRGDDRTRFFALLEQEMIRAGLRNVGTSYKEARKRGSIA